MKEITFYLGYEATARSRPGPRSSRRRSASTRACSSRSICICPVLRAGLGMLDPMLELLPTRTCTTSACTATRVAAPDPVLQQAAAARPAAGGGEGDVAFVLRPDARDRGDDERVRRDPQAVGRREDRRRLPRREPARARAAAREAPRYARCSAARSTRDSRLGLHLPGARRRGRRLFSTPAEAEARGRVIGGASPTRPRTTTRRPPTARPLKRRPRRGLRRARRAAHARAHVWTASPQPPRGRRAPGSERARAPEIPRPRQRGPASPRPRQRPPARSDLAAAALTLADRRGRTGRGVGGSRHAPQRGRSGSRAATTARVPRRLRARRRRGP